MGRIANYYSVHPRVEASLLDLSDDGRIRNALEEVSDETDIGKLWDHYIRALAEDLAPGERYDRHGPTQQRVLWMVRGRRSLHDDDSFYWYNRPEDVAECVRWARTLSREYIAERLRADVLADRHASDEYKASIIREHLPLNVDSWFKLVAFYEGAAERGDLVVVLTS